MARMFTLNAFDAAIRQRATDLGPKGMLELCQQGSRRSLASRGQICHLPRSPLLNPRRSLDPATRSSSRCLPQCGPQTTGCTACTNRTTIQSQFGQGWLRDNRCQIENSGHMSATPCSWQRLSHRASDGSISTARTGRTGVPCRRTWSA